MVRWWRGPVRDATGARMGMAGTSVVLRDLADSRSSENLKDVDIASRGVVQISRAQR